MATVKKGPTDVELQELPEEPYDEEVRAHHVDDPLPQVGERHAPSDPKEITTFCMIRHDGRLQPHEAEQIIRHEIRWIGQHMLERFSSFLAYFEGADERRERLCDVRELGIPGLIASRKLPNILEQYAQKMEAEQRARRNPGHQSHKPSQIVEQNTYVVFLGSRPFISSQLILHMGEIVDLRPRLIESIMLVNGLYPYAQADPYRPNALRVSVARDQKDHLLYNLRFVAEQFHRMSTEELLNRLE